MAFETVLTVPTRDLQPLMARLARAGFTVLDTGERVGTDEGPEAEATLRLLDVPMVEVDAQDCELGVTV